MYAMNIALVTLYVSVVSERGHEKTLVGHVAYITTLYNKTFVLKCVI